MKKKVTNKILWIFAIGQLGWSMLSGIVSNWLVFYSKERRRISSQCYGVGGYLESYQNGSFKV